MLIIKQLLRKILLFIITVNVEKYIKATRQDSTGMNVEKVHFRGESALRGHMVGGAFAMAYLFRGVAIIAFIIWIVSLIAIPIETQEDLNACIAIVLVVVISEIASLIMKFICLRNHETVNLYYEECVQIKKYGKKDIFVPYDELGKIVGEKGIRIRHGKLEIALQWGRLIIHCDSLEKSDFVQFLNHKCNISIPTLSQNEKTCIRKTGILSTFFKIGLALFVIDLGFVFIGSIVEHGTRTFREIYFPGGIAEFCEIHLFLLPIIPIIFLGLIIGIPNIFNVRKELVKYKIFRI